eukprot:Stramenopile-MAST_4_protein_3680
MARRASSTSTTCRVSKAVLGAALFCATVSGTAVEGIGRGGIARGKCYTVCPPVEYPTGHDPYYETAYFTLERELHGGPFGPGTLNPFNTNDVRNYLPRSAPQPFSEKLFTYSPPRNPYNPTFPNQAPSFLQMGESAFTHPAGVKTPSPANGAVTAVDTTSFLQMGLSVDTKLHPRSGMCLHVCPTHQVTNPAQEPLGGPFGPDPYFSQSKSMFVNKQGQSGFSSPAANFRNHHNEPYGGPFGADPYYIYGQGPGQHPIPDGYVPHRI